MKLIVGILGCYLYEHTQQYETYIIYAVSLLELKLTQVVVLQGMRQVMVPILPQQQLVTK